MSDAPQAPVTALLAEHCRGMRFETLPGGVIFSARQCLLDWLGVTLAGMTLIVILTVPQFANDSMRLIPIACSAAAIVCRHFLPAFTAGAVSLTWGALAFGLVWGGIRYAAKPLRVIGLGIFAPAVEKNLSGAGWQADGSQSVQVRELAQQHFGGNASSAIQVVVQSDAPLTSGDGPAVLAKATDMLRGDHRIAEIVAPMPGATLTPDGKTAIILAGAGADENLVGAGPRKRHRNAVRDGKPINLILRPSSQPGVARNGETLLCPQSRQRRTGESNSHNWPPNRARSAASARMALRQSPRWSDSFWE